MNEPAAPRRCESIEAEIHQRPEANSGPQQDITERVTSNLIAATSVSGVTFNLQSLLGAVSSEAKGNLSVYGC